MVWIATLESERYGVDNACKLRVEEECEGEVWVWAQRGEVLVSLFVCGIVRCVVCVSVKVGIVTVGESELVAYEQFCLCQCWRCGLRSVLNFFLCSFLFFFSRKKLDLQIKKRIC